MRPFAPKPTVLLLLVLAAGCATERIRRDSLRAFEQGAYEESIRILDEAARRDPTNMELLLDLRVRREAAVRQLLAIAEIARARGDPDGAVTYYRRVLVVEPGNDRALRGIEGVEADKRHAERTVRAAQLFAAKKIDAAELELQAVLAEDPAFAPARDLRAKLDLARGPMAVVPRLKSRDDRPVSLQFRDAPTKMVFEALARQTGLNFIFDKEVRSEGRTTIFVNQVPVEQAIDLILAQNQLGRQVLAENVALIYPNTAAKQKDYRDEVVHTFYLTNASPKDAETLLKTVLGTKTLFIDEKSGTVVMRDSPERVRMAEKLIASLDIPEPEVIMEIEVLEITHSLAEQLGINYPGNIALKATKPPDSGGSHTSDLVLSDLGKLNPNTIAISSLGISVDLTKTVGVTNVLSSPRVRARNKEKAKFLVGNRVPVVTSGTSATVGGTFSTSNVQYLDVGLTVEVQPTIHNDGDVAIKIAFEISSIVKQISVPIGNGATTLAYEIGTRNASTLLQLKDGETQVLAGLIQDSDQSSSTRIPGLGDLPVLGRLFGSNSTSRDKNEIVLSITPRVIRKQIRPTSDTTEFWYGTESQTRAAPLASGVMSGPGGVSFGAGSAVPAVAPVPTGAHAPPARIESATGRPPAPAAEAPAPQGKAPEGKAPAEGKAAQVKPADSAAGEGNVEGQAAGAEAKPKVTIEGPETAKVGEEIGVTVRLSSTRSLGRIRTQVGFDATALQVVSADPGDLAPAEPKIDTRPGGVQLEFSGEGAPLSGGGSLVNLRFRVVAARPVTVTTQVVLVGEDGVAVASTQATPLKITVSQ